MANVRTYQKTSFNLSIFTNRIWVSYVNTEYRRGLYHSPAHAGGMVGGGVGVGGIVGTGVGFSTVGNREGSGILINICVINM